MSDMLIRQQETKPEVFDPELLNGLQRSLEDHWYSGPRGREHIEEGLHSDVERGGVIALAARVELFLGRVASIASNIIDTSGTR